MNYILMYNGNLYPSDSVPLEPFIKKLFGKPKVRKQNHKNHQHSHNRRRFAERDTIAMLKTLCYENDGRKLAERLRTIGESQLKNGFMNKHHQKRFDQAVTLLDMNNSVQMSAVYLLTADYKLWKQSKRFVEKNRICFGAYTPSGCTEIGYSAYCAAKDIYLGTKHFTLSDLADKELITPKLFELLCNAMSIKRYGIEVLDHFSEE